LDAVDQDDLFVFNDFVDDPIIAAPRRLEPGELANQRLAQPLRVVGDRPEDGLKGGMANLLGKPVEMTQALGCDLDLVHPPALGVISQGEPLTDS
jgi:hypothetical protein